MSSLSLVLATVGRTETLLRMLDSLCGQLHVCPLEVLIVDQNADDRLVPIVTHARSNGIVVRHIRQPVANLSLARNRGIAEAQHEIVAFPDDDCWYGEGLLQQVCDALVHRPDLGGVAVRWCERVASSDGQEQALKRDEARRFRGPYFSSITLFLRRSVLMNAGVFDPRFGVGQWFGAGEESDLVLRVLDLGREVRYLPQAEVHHHYDPTPSQDLRKHCKSLRQRSRGTGALYVKHQLAAWVIARGLLAPLVMPLRANAATGDWRRGLAISVGRAEGMLRWWHREQRRQSVQHART